MSEIGLGSFLDEVFDRQTPNLGEQIAVRQQKVLDTLGGIATRLTRRFRRGNAEPDSPQHIPDPERPDKDVEDVAFETTGLPQADELPVRTAPVGMTAEQRENFMAQNPFDRENVVGHADSNKDTLRARIEAGRGKLAVTTALAASAATGVFLQQKNSESSEATTTDSQNDPSPSFSERMNNGFDSVAVGAGSAITALHFKVGERINKFRHAERGVFETEAEYRARTEKRGEKTMNILTFTAIGAAIASTAIKTIAGLDHGVSSGGAGIISNKPSYTADASWMGELSEYLDDKSSLLTQTQNPTDTAEYNIIDGHHLLHAADTGTGNGSGNQPTGVGGSSTWRFADGTGGERLVTSNGMDKSVWYNNEDEFARKFPELTYRMDDGHIGLIDQNANRHISKLPLAAQRFWESKR